MCELFAMSSRLPATVNLSLDHFAQHGSRHYGNIDGWGIAFFEGHGARLIKETVPAEESEAVRFIEQQNFLSTTVLAHVRHATRGDINYTNTHPFRRELGGREHVFAHNGDFPDLEPLRPPTPSRFQPLGSTDSEIAFCTLLHQLDGLWYDSRHIPPLTQRIQVVAEFAKTARRIGPANFLYADSDALFIHADRRRNLGEDESRPPGLHFLTRRCHPKHSALDTEGLKVSSQHDGSLEQEVVLAASVPLTDEGWTPMAEGEILVAQGGRIVERICPTTPAN